MSNGAANQSTTAHTVLFTADTLAARGDDMTLRRRRLSQRRKSVGLTQESLAHHLGVERSTVARWEAGHTEPLPSIRADVARALQMSTDQLAELLTESQTAQALPAGTDVTMAQGESEVWLGRAEFENLIRPRGVETVEAPVELGPPVVAEADPEATIVLRPALSEHAADIALPTDIDTTGADIRLDMPIRTTVGAGGVAGSDVPAPGQADVPDLSSVTTIPLHLPLTNVPWRRRRPRQFTRFAAAGILVVIGSAASVSLMTSHHSGVPPVTENPAPAAPVTAIPAPDPGPPAAAPDRADGPSPSEVTAASTGHTTRSTNRSTPPVPMMSAPRTPAIPAEAYEWSEMAKQLSGDDQSRARLRPESLPYP